PLLSLAGFGQGIKPIKQYANKEGFWFYPAEELPLSFHDQRNLPRGRSLALYLNQIMQYCKMNWNYAHASIIYSVYPEGVYRFVKPTNRHNRNL
ncbi:MAG: hypothetical protein QXP61_09185, partial [Nitrososphaerales archaeon]